jgi:hypothetical protein
MRLTVNNKSRFLIVTPAPVSKPVKPNTTKSFDGVDPIEMSRNAAAWERLHAEGLLDYWVGDDPNLSDDLEIVTAGSLVQHYVLHVDPVSGDDSGDGSLARPFLTIQAAIDYTASLSLDPLNALAGAEIRIPPGTIFLSEPLTHHGPNAVTLRGTPGATRLVGTDAVITCTNATPESLTAYRSSGLYSDLVNQGDAGATLVSDGLIFSRSTPGPAIEILGVQGDAGAGFTDFWGARFQRSQIGHTAGVYARNCRQIADYNASWWGKHVWRNVGIGITAYSMVYSIDTVYDSTDPEGQPSFGFLWQTSYKCSHANGNVTIGGEEPFIFLEGQHESGDVIVSDTALAALYNYEIDGNAVVNDTATFQHIGGVVNGNVTTAAGASWDARGVHIQGNLNFAAGAGTAQLDGGRYMGSLTDPGAKFVRNIGN